MFSNIYSYILNSFIYKAFREHNLKPRTFAVHDCIQNYL